MRQRNFSLYAAFLALALPMIAAGQVSADFVIVRDGLAAATIVVPDKPAPEESAAAKELSTYIQKITGASLAVVAEGAATSGPMIHVGKTKLVLQQDFNLDKLDWDGLVMRTVGSNLILCGRNPHGTEFAVYRFLYKFGGVRWYMPTEVGEHVPTRTTFTVPVMNLTENPDWLSRLWSAADLADKGEWNKRNLMRSRFSFHHYLNVWMQPSLFDQHPDWFPLRPNGQRYRPRPNDDSWQPCMSNPEVADYVAQRIIETFDKAPATISASIGVNDSGWQGYCQCDNCKALDVPGKLSLHGGPDYSNRFFTFANRVAEKVATKYPDHYIGCLAYNACENPPSFKVHPMIVPYLTNDRAQWRDAKFAEADRKWIAAWRAMCPSVATYTYEYGSGYIIPRVYFPLQKQYMQYCKDRGVKGWYAEIYCNWALDGPKAWIGSQLLWDTDQKVETLLDDFYRNFFGPARKPMQRYFELCQRQWMNQEGEAVWFRYFFDPHQLVLFPPEVCAQARQLLDQATALTTTEPYRKRLDLTSKAFHMTELYSAAYHAGNVSGDIASAANAEKTMSTLLTGIRADQERQTFLADVANKEPLLKPVIPFEERASFSAQAASPGLLWQLLNWCRDNGREDLAMKLIAGLAQSSPKGDMVAVAQTMWRLPSANLKNLITNGTFDKSVGGQGDTSGADWSDKGAPPGWSYWERNPGAGQLRWVSSEGEQYVSLTGVKGACYIQTVPVTPGSVYFVLSEYRGKLGDAAKATLVVSWQDAKGAWVDEFRRTTDLAPDLKHKGKKAAPLPTASSRWLTSAVACRTPANAAKAVVMLFADDQEEKDMIAFDNVRMFEAKADE